MKRKIALMTTAAALVTSAACGGGPGVSTQPIQPMGGLGTQADGAMTVGDLRQELLAFADRAMHEMVRASEVAMAADSAPATRAFVRSVQADIASTSVALAVEPDPERALLDLMVSIAAHNASLSKGAPDPLHPAAREALEGSLGFLEERIWSVGERAYTPAELAGLRTRLDQWQKSGEARAAGVIRVADLPASAGPAMGKGLFAPINQALREVEESRLLGERFLFLAERLPVISMWQAEAMTLDLLGGPEARQALDGLTLMSETLEQLVLRVDSLPATLDGQREAFLAAFDEREEGMRSLLDEAGIVMRDGRALAESGERVVALSNDAATSLNETLASAESLIAALRDADAPGGALSLDIDEYTTALQDFRAATETLNAALEKAEGLSDTPRDVIDHAAWRAAQLLVLLFVLLAAYRFGPKLVARRSARAP